MPHVFDVFNFSVIAPILGVNVSDFIVFSEWLFGAPVVLLLSSWASIEWYCADDVEEGVINGALLAVVCLFVKAMLNYIENEIRDYFGLFIWDNGISIIEFIFVVAVFSLLYYRRMRMTHSFSGFKRLSWR